jgi:hypothetical protein
LIATNSIFPYEYARKNLREGICDMVACRLKRGWFGVKQNWELEDTLLTGPDGQIDLSKVTEVQFGHRPIGRTRKWVTELVLRANGKEIYLYHYDDHEAKDGRDFLAFCLDISEARAQRNPEIKFMETKTERTGDRLSVFIGILLILSGLYFIAPVLLEPSEGIYFPLAMGAGFMLLGASFVRGGSERNTSPKTPAEITTWIRRILAL